MLGVPQSSISRLERGDRKVDVLELKKLAQIYLREPDYFTQAAPGAATIALLTPFNLLHPLMSRYPAYVFSELTEYFEAADYTTRIYQGKALSWQESGSESVINRLLADAARGEICGVVSLQTDFLPQNWVRQLAARQIPVVGDTSHFPYAVSFPYRQWVSVAIGHLVAQGRRRVAMMCWAEELLPLFQEELEKHGLEYCPHWVKPHFHPHQTGAGWSQLREIWTSRREKPDALIIADDQLVPDVCAGLREMSVRVPEQLMVVSHANAGCPLHATLPVAQLQYDSVAHAQTVGKHLLQLLRGEAVAQPHIDGSDQFILEPTPIWNDAETRRLQCESEEISAQKTRHSLSKESGLEMDR